MSNADSGITADCVSKDFAFQLPTLIQAIELIPGIILWQRGMSCEVCFAAWIPAIRATDKTSPFLWSFSLTRRRQTGDMDTIDCARAVLQSECAKSRTNYESKMWNKL